MRAYDIARAASWDAGNRSMKLGGRNTWNETDWNAMCKEFDRVMLELIEQRDK